MTLQLDTPVQFLKGVGPRRAEAFARLGIATVEDLLYHVPHRYLDATTVTPIAKADVGKEVVLVGRVVSKAIVPTRRRLRIFRAVLRDASGIVECAWPGQAFLDRVIQPGQLLLVAGPVKYYHGRQVAQLVDEVRAARAIQVHELYATAARRAGESPRFTRGLVNLLGRHLIAAHDHVDAVSVGCAT